jgi:hypothetical protein
MRALIVAGTAVALIAGTVIVISYPEGRITIKVVNDNSEPVEAADVAIGFAVMSKTYFGNEETVIRGLSGANGEFTGSAKGDSNLGFTIRKAGYYETTGKYNFKEAAADKWQPGNPTIIAILKKAEKGVRA